MHPLQILLFLVLAAGLLYGMYRFRKYLAAKEAAHNASVAHPPVASEVHPAAGADSNADHPKQA